MALTIGIVGLPNSGKSTLFNALTRNHAATTSYPFATIEPNVGAVGVPDARLPVLAEICASEKIIPATVSFVDIAGVVSGASRGEGMGNAFLAHIRQADAICQVTQAFAGDSATDPAADIETIATELILADLQSLEKATPRLEKEARIKKELQPKLTSWHQAYEVLSQGQTIASAGLDPEPLYDLWLLSAKPVIHVFNCDQDTLTDQAKLDQLRTLVTPGEPIFLDAKFEAELIELDEDEAREFLTEMGVKEPGLDQLARVGYSTLGLQSFLTAGPKEARAWTIHRGWTAPQAAGVIHTDFQKAFIKAEVVSYHDLVELGSMAAVRAAGKSRIEGKEYIMQQDDVVEFRHGKH